MTTTKHHNISRLWRPSRSVMRGSNWYAERNPRNRTGIEGPYRQPGYPVAWWLAMGAAAMGAIVLTWWPPAAPL